MAEKISHTQRLRQSEKCAPRDISGQSPRGKEVRRFVKLVSSQKNGIPPPTRRNMSKVSENTYPACADAPQDNSPSIRLLKIILPSGMPAHTFS